MAHALVSLTATLVGNLKVLSWSLTMVSAFWQAKAALFAHLSL